MNKLILGLLIVFVIAGGVVLFQRNTGSSGESVAQTAKSIFQNPSPTPFPLQELTIPFLRDRSYTSSLGPREKISENSLYTSYLTSYDSDGLKINGLLTIPKDGQVKHPSIIFVHGYIPPTQYQTTENYIAYVDNLARNGFVVFKIDLRGHDESEGEAGGAYYSSDYIIDTLNAYAALQTADFVAPDQIGLWGHSMAGNVLMRSFAVKTEIPAVVIWAGAGYTYADLREFGISDNSYQAPPQSTERTRRRQQLRDLYGEFDASIPFWQQVSPEKYLPELKGALQIHHAVDDNVVNIGYSRNLMELLDKTTVKHGLFEYATGGHNLTGSSFTQAMNRTVQFFTEELTKN